MNKKVKKSETAATAASFDVLVRPVITEKAMKSAEHGQVVFVVDINATKPQIKKAVESVFGVKVVSVNTLRQAGKVKVFRGTKGVRQETKKAIITLAEGQSIDVTAGV
ncbi:MAG: 50S ribosomal protein L23 [Lactobacillales bacterium]|jgi:large subunit ribosomal protein L23|nr:50S ribosomal protein L23 [Lactobacillales bacterium]